MGKTLIGESERKQNKNKTTTKINRLSPGKHLAPNHTTAEENQYNMQSKRVFCYSRQQNTINPKNSSIHLKINEQHSPS